MNWSVFYNWKVKPFLCRNKIILNNLSRNTSKNKVNLHYWEMDADSDFHNLGDWLSPIIVNYILQEKGLSLETNIRKQCNLYAIGSIIFGGFQNATIWGSGLIGKEQVPKSGRIRRIFQKYDIRCVRGPETRKELLSLGYKCPEVYGDPALLLPLFYKPKERSKKDEVAIIPHYTEKDEVDCKEFKIIDIVTDDWKKTVDEIYNSKFVISSSLHGIILAEAYGIPAILWKPEHVEKSWGGDKRSMFKYNDYYGGTGRSDFPFVKNIEDAFSVEPTKINDLKSIQLCLLKSFPYDLWE